MTLQDYIIMKFIEREEKKKLRKQKLANLKKKVIHRG